MHDWIAIVISSVALLLSWRSFESAKTSEGSQVQARALENAAKAECDLRFVLEKTKILPSYWGSVFAMRGVSNSSMHEQKKLEIETISKLADSKLRDLGELVDGLFGLKGKGLWAQLSRIARITAEAHQLKDDCMASWEHALNEQKQARPKPI